MQKTEGGKQDSAAPDTKPKKKICCACPETKVCASALLHAQCSWLPVCPASLLDLSLLGCVLQAARDECVTLHGPESERCAKLIEAHKQCLRSEGFNVSPGLQSKGASSTQCLSARRRSQQLLLSSPTQV